MASVEVFCRNVKAVLTQRNIRVKDLAEKIGVSESYLSLFLSGSRKNLSDEYKDRIAACLNLSMAQLYSEDFGTHASEEAPAFIAYPDRVETIKILDTFLQATHLEFVRPAFYATLAKLNDREALTVRSFLSSVLSLMSRAGKGQGEPAMRAMSMSDEARRLLAVYAMAGDGARIEWVKAASGLSDSQFDSLTQDLVSRHLVEIVEDVSGFRVNMYADPVPASSLFSHAKIREIHFALATAMQALPDSGPYAVHAIAEHLVSAGSNIEALSYFTKAAREMEAAGLWNEAAETWRKASVLSSVVGDAGRRANCLSEAAKCLFQAGDFAQASEAGEYACTVCEEMGNPRAVANICIMLGNMFRNYDFDAAVEWYKKGIRLDPPDLERGRLLVNLASALLEASRLDEADNTLRETLRWIAGRDPVEVSSISFKVSVNLGLIEYQRRNWKQARQHFESCLEQVQKPGGPDTPLDTVFHNLGMLMYRDDDMTAARDYLTRAQALYWEKGNRLPWAYAAIELAKVSLREGVLDEVQKHLASAEPYLEEKSVHERGWISLIRACVDLKSRRVNQAIENGRKALDIFQREGSERDAACAALWLSSACKEAGDSQQAASLERRAFQIYERRHWDVRELHRERSLLEPKSKSRQQKGRTQV